MSMGVVITLLAIQSLVHPTDACMQLARATHLRRTLPTGARVRLARSARAIISLSDGGGGGSILQRVNAQVKEAMRSKETAKLTALRNIKAALLVAMKEQAGADDLPDDKAQPILRKLAKMRRESMDMFAKAPGGGAERIAEEAAELEIIEAFLPQLASEAQTRAWIEEVMSANPGADAGRVMGGLMKAHRTDVDGKLAQRLVKEMLG
jgi:uncharacterized protein YqeY